MGTSNKSIVFRVTGLPVGETDDDVKSALSKTITGLLSKDEMQPEMTIALAPSCDDDKTSIALVEFGSGIPHFLSPLVGDPLKDRQCQMGSDTDITFDRHFFGFTQLYATEPGHPVTADIIAITELDGHAYGSWRGKGILRRMWLRDFLSKDMPHCRTMIYGYNSKLKSLEISKIMDYGREFMEEIKKVRYTKELRERPLFFIAHGFGGIILAHCLVKAVQMNKDDDPTIAALHKATYGILFFGTPHKGLMVDDIKSMLAADADHPRNALLEQINLKSDLLIDQLADFKNLIRDRKIVSFYETEQTRRLKWDPKDQSWSRGGDYITAVDTDSAILQLPDLMEIKIPLHANHSQMVKFDSRGSQAYKSALQYLRQYERDAPKIVSDRFLSQAVPNLRHTIADWLSPLNFIQKQSDVLDRRHPGTGQWLLDSDMFRDWLSGAEQTLWCRGIPGAGKTVLVSIVVDHLRQKFQEEKIGIACIYCDYKDRIEQTPVNVIGSLLKQLIQVQKQLPISEELNTLYKRHERVKTRPTLDECSKVLRSEVRRYTKVFVVIDALDECPEDDGTRARLLKELGALKDTINLMVTSRPHINIENEFVGVKPLEVLAINEDDGDISVGGSLAHLD
ncbi:hypothetical protein FGG08_005382 [Glutinoglossum americanum]|uniref:Nephrocystin 3-like N-terminal domain-containing protein n=1 Tax=Glutinoglossum americanum TaxID=1670608 RepID=A0A9P8L1H6_9PEZI|nr:hypothetical protein FGG08_005382 [Glutinoglossum americanum]